MLDSCAACGISGFFVYDALTEYMQVETGVFSTHHPLVHVIMLGNIICTVHNATGSYNLGIACYMIVQMVMMCSTKDTIFTAALLLLLVCILGMCISTDYFFDSKLQMAIFVLSSLTMILFRKNAFYAFTVMTPVFIIYFRKKIKKMAILLAVIFISFFLIDESLTLALHADDLERQEILPEEALALYTPKLSDPVKYYFKNAAFDTDKLKYVKLWAKIGLRKPFAYINAWLINTYGLWYPDTVVDVYAGNVMFTFEYKDSSYFEHEVEPPGVKESMIPWLDEVYRKMSLEIVKEKIPIVSMVFSPGFLFWCYAFGPNIFG